jgi:hypothetical protein
LAQRRQIDPFMSPLMIVQCGTLARENRKALKETRIEPGQGENLISNKVKLSLRLLSVVKHWRSGGIAPPFLTSVVHGGELSASRFCRFTPRKMPLVPIG